MEELTYPIRINRYLAKRNFCSRREADVLIEKGIVTINGRKAVLGDRVNENDVVEVDTKVKDSVKKYEYFAYYKPIGVITHSPSEGQKSIQQMTDIASDVFPVGRLDIASHGLIILTNDGRITEKLLHPEFDHQKEYYVTVNKRVNNQFLKHMRRGIQLEDFLTKECEVEKMDNDFMFRIVLTEGKKHQIRRMCTALGYEVLDLKRVRIMNIVMKKMRPGQKRKIAGEELNIFLKKLNLC
ncbi:MAG: Pseudouridine synthase [uncultured bacterium]|nr:MAG: Pseudouridine synthase [uncultured bacterium]HCU71130.1 23S rRNA pseudouridine synthase F [Candidatus Moranbacteria bacterium]